jgi:hypothetical protein
MKNKRLFIFAVLLISCSYTPAPPTPDNQAAVRVPTVASQQSGPAVSVPLQAQASGADSDGDGLDDTFEDDLARRFMPSLWFASGEKCISPASSALPGTVLVRVRPHPADASKIALGYSVLYADDCGSLFGIGKHKGDVEPLSLTLSVNAACPSGYGAYSIKTISHEGSSTEHVDEELLSNSCAWDRDSAEHSRVARVFVAKSKHGNYLSLESCDRSGFLSLDKCGQAFTREFRVYNTGEDGARRLDSLSDYGFPGEFAWSEVNFCGGRPRSKDCPSPVRTKLLKDSLLARAN